MFDAKTFTTPAGATYSYTVTTGDHGEAVYDLSRVFQDGAAKSTIGAIVIHPDYNLDPIVPGLLNVQFGKGSVDRHERTDVPLLGTENAPYVIGHQLVNPADLEVEKDAEKPVTDPWVNLTRTVRGAVAPVEASSFQADTETCERVRDLVTALIKVYRQDEATASREAQYSKFLDEERALALAPQIQELTAKINVLWIARDELVDRVSRLTA
ncbi:hypothetical protein [Streptomyces sp. NPDC047525]|uniref:hypothetical protein n=1 Tax=Streptomyces sp. NPDC047525 TaxID=3155264 RepID=UPI0033C167AC